MIKRFRAVMNNRGVSMADMILAVMLFSLVTLALFSLAGTFTKLAFTALRGNVKLDNIAALTMRTLQAESAGLTQVVLPASGAGGNLLEGLANVDDQTPPNPINGLTPGWFAFCIQSSAGGLCSPQYGANPAPCLFHHRGTGSTIPAIKCGQSGGTFELIASGVDCTQPAGNCFTRSADGLQVRAAFTVNSPIDLISTKSMKIDLSLSETHGY